MDDGAADHCGVTLQTHSFSHDGVRRLQHALYISHGIAATIRRNRSGEILYIGRSEIASFQSLVIPHVLPGLHYKLIPRKDAKAKAARRPPLNSLSAE
jgi:hypothetical protein